MVPAKAARAFGRTVARYPSVKEFLIAFFSVVLFEKSTVLIRTLGTLKRPLNNFIDCVYNYCVGMVGPSNN